MALEREALTHKIEDDLALRNRNWNQLDSHLADYATLTKTISVIEDFDSLVPTTLDFGFTPSKVYISCTIDFTKYITYGVASNPSQNSLIHYRKDMDGYNISSQIFLSESDKKRIVGTISFKQTGITINWFKEGIISDITPGTKRKISVTAFKK